LGTDLEVHRIDVSLSPEATFSGPNLIIVPNFIFAERNPYYINFDGGVVQSVVSVAEGCQLANEPILSETFWTFKATDLTSSE